MKTILFIVLIAVCASRLCAEEDPDKLAAQLDELVGEDNIVHANSFILKGKLQRSGCAATINVNAERALGRMAAAPESLRGSLRRIHLEDQEMTAAAAVHLSKFVNLEHLSARAWKDEWTSDLTTLPNLKVIDLAGAKCNGSCLQQIAKIKTLEAVIISQNPLKSESLKPLAQLKNLRQLDISGCPLTDADVTVLAQLPELTSLQAADTMITDESVPTLLQLKRLSLLALPGTKLSPEGLMKLTEGLPQTIISWEER
jgi:hypothetical protein